MHRRSWLALLPAWLAAPRAFAADAPDVAPPPPKYVVLSLVGDRVSYLGGTHPSVDDAGGREDRAPAPTSLDAVAQRDIVATLARTEPGAAASVMDVTTPAWFADDRAWFEDDALKLPPALAGEVLEGHARFLLLLAKARGSYFVGQWDKPIVNERPSGLGFCQWVEPPSADAPTGFRRAVPFFYADLSLVDLSTMRRMRKYRIRRVQENKGDVCRIADLRAMLAENIELGATYLSTGRLPDGTLPVNREGVL